jgi:hypothetical protein
VCCLYLGGDGGEGEELQGHGSCVAIVEVSENRRAARVETHLEQNNVLVANQKIWTSSSAYTSYFESCAGARTRSKRVTCAFPEH